MKPYSFPRSRKLGWTTLVGLVLVMLYSYANQGIPEITRPQDASSVERSLESIGTVTRVIDGDTIVANIRNNDYTVRMIGINTPETVDPRKTVECFGKEASHATKNLLPQGTTVVLKADTTQDRVDTYGRLLRYVYREPDKLFINEYLVRQGFAHEYTYNKNPHLNAENFRTAEEAARTEGKGLWAPGVCDVL